MKKGKRFEEKINKKTRKLNIKKIIMLVLFLFFVLLFLYSGIKIVKYIVDGKKNNKILDDISKSIEEVTNNDTTDYNIDFASLKEKNPDTVAFIKVEGTDVKHIVVKGNNNEFYLYHNFEKQNNIAGWIFADYRNKFDGSDKNIIVYGHNMKNNTMFATLKNILNKDWQEKEENRNIIFKTEKESAIYKVFSVYQIEPEDYYITTSFTKNEFTQFVKTIKSRSVYDFNVDVNEDDQILTLSTCDSTNKYRIVLHAKKVIE